MGLWQPAQRGRVFRRSRIARASGGPSPSWSDGGAMNHAYTVANSTSPDTLTATYVPAEHVAFVTSPPNLTAEHRRPNELAGLHLRVGRGRNPPDLGARPQTDAQGRTWAFANWSIGGARGAELHGAGDSGQQCGRHRRLRPGGASYCGQFAAGNHRQGGWRRCATPCNVQRAVGATVRVSAPLPFARRARTRRFHRLVGQWRGAGFGRRLDRHAGRRGR